MIRKLITILGVVALPLALALPAAAAPAALTAWGEYAWLNFPEEM